MTVLYRAMWTDARADARSSTLAAFERWAREKSGLPPAEEGAGAPGGDPHTDSVTYEFDAEEAGDDEVGFARAELVETHADGSRWQTIVRTWRAHADSPGTWVWVDVDAVSPVGITDVTIAAPRVVRDLLTDGVLPRSGPVELAPFPRYFSGEDGGERLAEILTDPERLVPAVVFSDAPAVTDDLLSGRRFTFTDVVDTTALRLAGVAPVYVLDVQASAGFCEAVGREHGVADGACRIYQPVLDPALETPWRHPIVLPTRYLTSRETAARAAVRSLGALITTRRPPASFGAAKALLDEKRRAGHGDADWVTTLKSDNSALRDEALEAKQSLSNLEDDYLGAVSDLESETRRNATLVIQLDIALRENRWLGDKLLATEGERSQMYSAVTYPAYPALCGSCTEAVQLAREHLADRLFIPDAACRDLEDLDTAVEAVPWGQKAWDGFLALHAYAEHLATSDQTMDFYNWCRTSGDPRIWPANDKHLAMTESATVRQNKKLAAQRVLPVSGDVDPSGRMYMEAHLKLATGGGMLAPRIYFHLDRPSASAHVGFFGPHKHMSNTKT